MGKVLNLAVLGLIAAALMLVAKVGLMRLNLPNYPGVQLSGHEGLMTLALDLGLGALFAVVFGFFVRPILPSGALVAALIFSTLPFIFFAMVWPMWRGGAMVSDTWRLVYMELHLYIFSLALVLLGRGGPGRASGKE